MCDISEKSYKSLAGEPKFANHTTKVMSATPSGTSQVDIKQPANELLNRLEMLLVTVQCGSLLSYSIVERH